MGSDVPLSVIEIGRMPWGPKELKIQRTRLVQIVPAIRRVLMALSDATGTIRRIGKIEKNLPFRTTRNRQLLAGTFSAGENAPQK